MEKEEIKVSVVFATAGAKRNVKEFTGELQEMEGQTKKTSKNADGSFKSMRSSAARNLGRAGLAGIAVAASGAVVMGFNRMMEKGKEYQNSLADLEAITGITGSDLQELSSNALNLSVKYGEAANNIIEANKLVASQLAEKIDFGTDEGLRELQEVSEQAVILQKAAGVDLATSVRTLTTAINQFNLPASETERLINSIAAGSKFGAAEVAQQADAYKESGSVAAAANLQFEALNGAVQVLAANAIQGSQAGTQLRNVILTLNNPAKLAEQGIEGVNLQSEGLSASLDKLNPLLEDSAALEKLFGREAITAAQILIKNADAVGEMTEKVTDSNVAQEQLGVQMNTFQTAQSRLSSALDKELITAFEKTNGVGVRLTDTLTNMIVSLGKATEQLGDFLDEGDRIENIQKAIEGNAKSTKAYINAHGEARKILKGLTQQTNKYNREVDISAGYVEDLTEWLEKLDEGSELFINLTETVKDSRLKLKLLELVASKLVETTKEQIKTAEANGQSTGLLEEQQREYVERLSHVQSALEATNKIISDNDDANKKTTTSVKNLAEQRKENTVQINKLLIKSEDLTEAEWRDLKALTAQNKAIAEQIKLRELAADPSQLGEVEVSDKALNIEAIIEADNQSFDDELWEKDKKAHEAWMKMADERSAKSKKIGDVQTSVWEGTEEAIGQAAAQQILYVDSVEEGGKAIIKTLINEIVARAILSAFSPPTPASLILAPILAATATRLISSFIGLNEGGEVPGHGPDRDSVHAMLTPREYIVNRTSATVAPSALRAINSDPRIAREVENYVTGTVPERVPFKADFSSPRQAATGGAGNDKLVEALDRQSKALERLPDEFNFPIDKFHSQYKRFLDKEAGL